MRFRAPTRNGDWRKKKEEGGFKLSEMPKNLFVYLASKKKIKPELVYNGLSFASDDPLLKCCRHFEGARGFRSRGDESRLWVGPERRRKTKRATCQRSPRGRIRNLDCNHV